MHDLSIQLPQHPSSLFFSLRELMHATCRRFVVGRYGPEGVLRLRARPCSCLLARQSLLCFAVYKYNQRYVIRFASGLSSSPDSVACSGTSRLVALDDACEAGTTPSLTAEKQFFFFAACDLMRSLSLLSMQANSGTGQRSNSEFRGAVGR